jgi:phenylacetate-coenzyme A ligase PaaK-like adenylate-forming protein
MDNLNNYTNSSTNIRQNIESVTTETFEATALQVFRWQVQYNPIYKSFIALLKIEVAAVKCLAQIPFLPISFFKTHTLQTGTWQPETVFTSSGTTGSSTSRHYLKDTTFYTRNTLRGFEYFYGNVTDYCILALLPAYLERSGSSLVYMANEFIARSRYAESGFFLDNLAALCKVLQQNQRNKIPTLLLGVSFALLDLAEQHPQLLTDVIIMETGGMKGRRKELIRNELHHILQTAFAVPHIHSEYGMTELLSQAYSLCKGVFRPAPTMRVLVRDPTDPLHILATGQNGCLNIIDLANLDTCSFVATDDLGRAYDDGTFEVIGRVDASDVRGCNLLVL